MKTSLREKDVTSKEVAQDQAFTIGSGMQVGISSFGAWMLGVGSIIGSMAWLIHGPMIAKSGPLAAFVAWILAAAMTLPLALIVAELSSMFPTAGGPYVYKYFALKRMIPGMGEMLGFLTGWLFWIAMITGLGCMSNGLTNLLSSVIWNSSNASPLWFGPLIILSLFVGATILNQMQVGKAAQLSNLFTLMKFAMALGFGALVLLSPNASLSTFLQPVSPQGNTNFWSNVFSVLMLAIAGYGGIEVAGCTSSETKNARKSVPRAIILTLAAVTLFYTGMCFAVSAASSYVLSPDKTTTVIAGTNIQATCPALAGFLAGPFWGSVMTAAVVASIVGCGFSCLLTLARVGYSMAETGLFPKQFARLNSNTGVPTYALWFQCWCLCLVGIAANLAARTGLCPDAYAFLAEVFGFIYAFLALLYGFCLIGLRYTDPHMPRPFRLGKKGNGVAWVMTLFAGLVYGYAAFACTQWSHQLTALLLLLAGIPIYMFYRVKRSDTIGVMPIK